MLDFLLHAVPTARLLTSSAFVLPTAVAFLAGRCDNSRFKEAVLGQFFAGRSATEFEQSAKEFADHRLPRLIRPAALERLRWHIGQGHRVVITTASIEAYVRPWAHENGVGEVLGTRLEVDGSGRLTGRLDGANCYGPEKVARLLTLIGDVGWAELYVYGDSEGDRELLALATHPSFRPFRRLK